MRDFVLTSTSVTDGHPDKLCDRMSDAIVDTYLARDTSARVIAECAITAGIVFVAAQTQSSASVDVTSVIRETVAETGYRDADFNPENVTILTRIAPKSAIYGGTQEGMAETVNTTVFGFACDHTPEMLPASLAIAHRLAKGLARCRSMPDFAWLHPDGQAQVAIGYRDRRPRSVEGITLFAALNAGAPKPADVAARLGEAVIDPVLRASDLPPGAGYRLSINPAPFPGTGGPGHHAGLTGRKNDIDCYGGYSRHGGAALSGKHPLRIDRAAAYAARHAAKTVVASGLARECEVQLSYALGKRAPVSVALDCFGTASVPEDRVLRALQVLISFDAQDIASAFRLVGLPQRHGGRFFRQLAVFGHFGRMDMELPWEATDKAEELTARAG